MASEKASTIPTATTPTGDTSFPLSGSITTAREPPTTSPGDTTSQTTSSSEDIRNVTSTTSTSPSSSFPVAIVGALVGVLIALLIIIIIVDVVIVACFRRRRKKHLMNEADRGTELNTYNKLTHINSDITKQPPPPAVSTDEDTVSPVLPVDGDVSTDEDTVSPVLPADDAMREKGPPDGSADQVSIVTEVSAAKAGDLESNMLIDSHYSAVTVEEEHGDLQQPEPSSSTKQPETEDEASYSLVDIPTVPKKSPELYQDREGTGESACEGKAVQGAIPLQGVLDGGYTEIEVD